MAHAALEAVQEQIARCNRCGFCQAACPIYSITGREAATARGHNELVRRILEGDLALTADMQPSFAECLLCRACTAHCFPALPTDRVVTAARAAFNRRRPGAAVEERVMRAVMSDPGRMARLVRLAYFGKRSGALRALRLLRWLPWLPKGLAQAEAIMPAPPRSFLRDRVERLNLPAQGPRGTVTYFVGCGMNFGFPDAAQDSLRLLAGCGYGVRIADNVCCGLPAYTHGHLDLARDLARANISRLADADLVVTDCASCSSFLKHYAELLSGDPAAEGAAAFAARVRDLCEVISPDMLSGARWPGAVTYHQPCHLARYQGLAARPPELLQTVRDLEFRPLPEADWCCGAAGTYVVSQYEMSMGVLARKMTNVRAALRQGLSPNGDCPLPGGHSPRRDSPRLLRAKRRGKQGHPVGQDCILPSGSQIENLRHAAAATAPTVVTSCPACLAQLAYGARRHGLAVTVRHLSQILRPPGYGPL